MLDNEISEIVKRINENTKKIDALNEELKFSEARRETAENLLSQIKESASTEIKKAYESGYNAALTNANPEGGTTISNKDDKILVLSNQN